MALFSCFQFLFSWMPSMRLCSTRFFFSMQKSGDIRAECSQIQNPNIGAICHKFIYLNEINLRNNRYKYFFHFPRLWPNIKLPVLFEYSQQKMAISLFFHWIILNDKVDFSTCDYYLQNKRIRPQTSDIGLMLLNVGVFFFSFRSPFPPTFPNTWKLKINIRMKKKNGRLTTEAHKKNAEHVKHPLPRGCCALRTNFYGSPFTLF